MVYIQQIFIDNKPTRLLANLELAPLGTPVGAVMSYTDLPLGVKDLFLSLLLSQRGTTLRVIPASEVPVGLTEVVLRLHHCPASLFSVPLLRPFSFVGADLKSTP